MNNVTMRPMRSSLLNTWLLSLYVLIVSAASPSTQLRGPVKHLPEIPIDPSDPGKGEPTCDELRAMWRFSKRQSRTAERTNEYPTYRDPFAYNIWEERASLRRVGGGKVRRPLVYGRVVHHLPRRPWLQDNPDRIRAYEEVTGYIANPADYSNLYSRRRPPSTTRQAGSHHGINALSGSFQHLKDLVQAERARELREQKISEENAARRGSKQYQRTFANQKSPYGQWKREDLVYNTGRSRGKPDGLESFPEVSVPSNGFYRNLDYEPRTYLESLVRPAQFTAQASGRYSL